MNYYKGNIEQETLENKAFRKVVFTGEHMQLVFMTVQPGEDIGLESHEGHDQFIRIESGTARFLIGDGEFEGSDDFAVIIPSGAQHNVTNIGETELQLYTIYAPKEHPENTVHQTKADAESSNTQ